MSVPLSPQDLSLPPKFASWRPGQWDAIEKTIQSPNKFIVCPAPTGFGKSPFAMAVAKLEGGRSITYTSTKALQTQYMDDFAPMGLFDMRGRQNYQCVQARNCHEGRVYGCREKEACPSWEARQYFLNNPLNVTNYAYGLASIIHGEGIGPVDLLICDEAHSAVEELASAIEVHLDHAQCEPFYQRFDAYPQPDYTLDDFRSWAGDLLPKVLEYLTQLKDSRDDKKAGLTDHFKSTLEKIADCPPDWILDKSDRAKTIVAPLWPTDFVHRYLFTPEVKRALLVSATIVPKTTDLLNIPRQEATFLNQNYAFDFNRCPVYVPFKPKIDFRSSDEDYAMQTGMMDTVIQQRLDRKGIIHCTSYERGRQILSRSYFSRYMVFPQSSRELPEAIRIFRETPPPVVLMSPAVTTGYDFPMSQCEYQIHCKVPFIDTRGPIMTARKNADPEYPIYLTIQSLVQACGRAMRSDRDQCENFILDGHIRYMVSSRSKYTHLFPSWFLRQIRWSDGIPQPPPPLSVAA